jgi:hypothetical protein
MRKLRRVYVNVLMVEVQIYVQLWRNSTDPGRGAAVKEKIRTAPSRPRRDGTDCAGVRRELPR